MVPQIKENVQCLVCGAPAVDVVILPDASALRSCCLQHALGAVDVGGCTVLHSVDSDCILDRDDLCILCHVLHGDPCWTCQRRGYHKAGCSQAD
jgi:hypothetical protein